MGPCQQSLKSGPIQDVHEHVQFTPSDLYRTLRTLWHRPDVLQGTQMFQCCVHIHRWPQKHCRYWLLELQILASRQIHKYRLIIDKCQMVLNAMEKSDGQIILDQVDLGGGWHLNRSFSEVKELTMWLNEGRYPGRTKPCGVRVLGMVENREEASVNSEQGKEN